ncbi:hypothetical protein Tcan_03869 [Toxocara canis]|uniref:Uncharacterized protein n=1 Tax=Toxocara canis TaxID=6265 RepID=A0A0B2V067_TOXCA|nr:hypothetical protein Tcan_03869 [Toxocara canis]
MKQSGKDAYVVIGGVQQMKTARGSTATDRPNPALLSLCKLHRQAYFCFSPDIRFLSTVHWFQFRVFGSLPQNIVETQSASIFETRLHSFDVLRYFILYDFLS